jgi:hypothetical protein
LALFGGKKKEAPQDPFAGMPMQPGPDMGMPPPDTGMGTQQGASQQDPYGQQYYNQPVEMSPMPPPDMGMQQGPPDFQNYPSQDYGSGFPPPSQGVARDDIKERIEEIAEAIIDEKWNEILRDINKVVEWKERTDGEIKRIQQEIIDLKERFDQLHKGVLGKISEYDQNLTNVGTQIKAMDMVFQKILPTFTENVNKLDRLAKLGGSK